jgi:hypothetical protein
MTMTKKEIYNEIYRKLYKVRFYMGYYCENSTACTPERAERFAARMAETEAQEKLLLDLTEKLHISPLLKKWYYDAFDIGFKAMDTGACIVPEDLMDKD